jgi:hypothetical protein
MTGDLHKDMLAGGTITRPAIFDSVRIVIRHAVKIWTGVEMAAYCRYISDDRIK